MSKVPTRSRYLSLLHKNFVLAPIDKASGNVAVICKRFYAEVLVKELGLEGPTSDTYELVQKNKGDIVESHVKHLKQKFDLDVSNENNILPNIYWYLSYIKTP